MAVALQIYARASGAAPCRNGRGVLEASGEFKWSGTGGEHNTASRVEARRLAALSQRLGT